MANVTSGRFVAIRLNRSMATHKKRMSVRNDGGYEALPNKSQTAANTQHADRRLNTTTSLT
jgi:hypothetical protein